MGVASEGTAVVLSGAGRGDESIGGFSFELTFSVSEEAFIGAFMESISTEGRAVSGDDGCNLEALGVSSELSSKCKAGPGFSATVSPSIVILSASMTEGD